MTEASDTKVTLRRASNADAPALCRLAQLDSRPLPAGPHLVAEREGSIDAAVSLPTGEVVANPFVRTAELSALLRVHAATREAGAIGGGAPRRRPARPRPVGATA